MQFVVFLNSNQRTSQAAFTLIEVMIAVAVLAIGMFGVLSMIPTLAQARTLAVEMVIARQIADSVAERIQGAAWRDLGGTKVTAGSYNIESWSLPRYRSPAPLDLNPPMTEDAPDPNNNLLANGLVSQRTGVPDLKVYLEYYTGLIMNGPDLSKRATDRKSWYNAISGITGQTNRMITFTNNGDAANASVIVRIIVTWKEQNGTPVNTHEIFTSRKQ